MTESCLPKETMPPACSSILSSWLHVDLSEKLLKNNTDEPGNKAKHIHYQVLALEGLQVPIIPEELSKQSQHLRLADNENVGCLA